MTKQSFSIIAHKKLEAYTEAACSSSCKNLLTLFRADVYSIEVGFVSVPDPNSEKGWKSRPGGTRTTPGFPDLFAMLPEPYGHTFDYVLTVEAKGAATSIKPAQWLYAWRAMARGIPHFIVRSPSELLTGMAYMALLPTLFFAPWWDNSEWPQNVNFLDRANIMFWMANHHEDACPSKAHSNRHGVTTIPTNRRTVPPATEAEAIAQFAEKRRPRKS